MNKRGFFLIVFFAVFVLGICFASAADGRVTLKGEFDANGNCIPLDNAENKKITDDFKKDYCVNSASSTSSGMKSYPFGEIKKCVYSCVLSDKARKLIDGAHSYGDDAYSVYSVKGKENPKLQKNSEEGDKYCQSLSGKDKENCGETKYYKEISAGAIRIYATSEGNNKLSFCSVQSDDPTNCPVPPANIIPPAPGEKGICTCDYEAMPELMANKISKLAQDEAASELSKDVQNSIRDMEKSIKNLDELKKKLGNAEKESSDIKSKYDKENENYAQKVKKVNSETDKFMKSIEGDSEKKGKFENSASQWEHAFDILVGNVERKPDENTIIRKGPIKSPTGRFPLNRKNINNLESEEGKDILMKYLKEGIDACNSACAGRTKVLCSSASPAIDKLLGGGEMFERFKNEFAKMGIDDNNPLYKKSMCKWQEGTTKEKSFGEQIEDAIKEFDKIDKKGKPSTSGPPIIEDSGKIDTVIIGQSDKDTSNVPDEGSEDDLKMYEEEIEDEINEEYNKLYGGKKGNNPQPSSTDSSQSSGNEEKKSVSEEEKLRNTLVIKYHNELSRERNELKNLEKEREKTKDKNKGKELDKEIKEKNKIIKDITNRIQTLNNMDPKRIAEGDKKEAKEEIKKAATERRKEIIGSFIIPPPKDAGKEAWDNYYQESGAFEARLKNLMKVFGSKK